MTGDNLKTIKIRPNTHEKLMTIKDQIDAKSLSDTIESVLGGHEVEKLSIDLRAEHLIPTVAYENIKTGSRIYYQFSNLNDLAEKVNVLTLLHRAIVNTDIYYTATDHFNMVKDIKGMDSRLSRLKLSKEELINKIDGELDKIRKLGVKLQSL